MATARSAWISGRVVEGEVEGEPTICSRVTPSGGGAESRPGEGARAIRTLGGRRGRARGIRAFPIPCRSESERGRARRPDPCRFRSGRGPDVGGYYLTIFVTVPAPTVR